MAQYFYDRQIRRYIQQFIRLFSGFSVQMGVNDDKLPIFQTVPVRYGDINRMAAHITRENSENIVNTVPFISCYVTSLDMAPTMRTYQNHVEKVQVYEKKVDSTTGQTTDELGNRYTIERYAPVPYTLIMNCDIWTSNTDQKLQLLEQIMVLFNPTLNIHTTDNPFDWSSLSFVEMTNSVWSSRSVGSGIDDIVDASTLTFSMPIYINPPAKVKQQKLIHTLINQLYSLDDEDLDNFRNDEPFDTSTLQYTVVTFEDYKLSYENGSAYLLASNGSSISPKTGALLEWENELKPFGVLREGISQIRLRKSSDPGDTGLDVIGRLSFDDSNPNALFVDIDPATIPSNTLTAIDAVIDPSKNFPGDGVVPPAAVGQRYLLASTLPVSSNWTSLVANVNDIIEFNGTNWIVSFASQSITTQQFVTNVTSSDQLEWTGTEWINSFEGVYNAGFWRVYL
jgi:hypothetical protein